jgi:hypothetical protein
MQAHPVAVLHAFDIAPVFHFARDFVAKRQRQWMQRDLRHGNASNGRLPPSTHQTSCGPNTAIS